MMFITVEGIDGSGKSTQAKLLHEWLSDHKQLDEFKIPNVDLFRDPGNTPAGDAIRKILLDRDIPMSKEAQLLLFTAARSELAKEINVKLRYGHTVISDRWVYSTIAYQGYGHGCSIDLIRRLADQFNCGLVPDLTFILDMPVREAMDRVRRAAAKAGDPTNDRFETQSQDFFERLRVGYRNQVDTKTDGTIIHLIDATQTVVPVQQLIRDIVYTTFKNKHGVKKS